MMFETQEAIKYIRGILKSFRYTLPASFLDEVEAVLNKWDEQLLKNNSKQTVTEIEE